MRIGVMLRHYGQHEGGLKVYTHNLLPHLLSADTKNEYVLIYQNPTFMGTYAGRPRVEEVAVRVPGNILWDQVAVPWIVRKKRIDLIFNPKFTVPFLSRAKKVFVLHGAEWFVIPEAFLWYDAWYAKTVVPWYCRRADRVVTVSDTVRRDIVRFCRVSPEKVVPIHNGFDDVRFRVICDPQQLAAAKEKYALPDRFILWVGQMYPPKNCARLFEAFARIKHQIPHYLVIAGERRWKAETELRRIKGHGIEERLRFTGWVSHEDLPAFYNLADLFVFPSLYEGFGIPLLEAMACGCPVLTANTGTPPEVVGGAAHLVNPVDVGSIAEGILRVLVDRELRERLRARGLERAKTFSWRKCAEETLQALEEAGRR